MVDRRGQALSRRVLFRVAGGPRVGFGHIRRCWTLANQLEQEEREILFTADSEQAVSVLTRAGFSTRLETPGGLETTVGLLGKSPEKTLCVADDPALGPEQLKLLADVVPTVCIDDTADRFFPVDCVVNGSAGIERRSLRGRPDTQFLLGAGYILLRPEFAEPPRRLFSKSIGRVLLLAGGGEADRFIRKSLETVFVSLGDVRVDLVVGPFGTVPDGIPASVGIHREPPDIRPLMLQADLAISAGGQTLYELAAAAAPTIGIQTAENQKPNLDGLSEAGAIVFIGGSESADFAARLKRTLHQLSDDPGIRQTLGEGGRKTVDGNGTERVARHLNGLIDSKRELLTG